MSLKDKIKEPGYYTNGNTSDDALILEARGYLAMKHGYIGRSQDIFACFYHGRNVPETLTQFDRENIFWGTLVN